MKRKLLMEESDERPGSNIGQKLDEAAEGMRAGIYFCFKLVIVIVILLIIFFKW